MSNNVMMDPIVVISFSHPARSVTPSDESAIEPGALMAFTSLAGLDAALISTGDAEKFVDSLNINDKVFRLRQKITDGDYDPFGVLPTATTDTVDPVDEVMSFGAVWVNTVTPEVFQTNGDGTWTSVWSGV